MPQTVTERLIEFFRYGITGIISLLSYLAFSNLLYFVGCTPSLATVVAWIISVLVSYFGHIHFSYKVDAEHKIMAGRFACMLVFQFLLTAGLTYLFLQLVGLTYFMTTVFTVMITPFATFPMGKYWVFKTQP